MKAWKTDGRKDVWVGGWMDGWMKRQQVNRETGGRRGRQSCQPCTLSCLPLSEQAELYARASQTLTAQELPRELVKMEVLTQLVLGLKILLF